MNDELPVHELANNIIHKLETVHDEALELLKEGVQRDQVKPGIGYLKGLEEDFVAKAKPNGKILFSESFFAYIWAITYYFLGTHLHMTESLHQNPDLEKEDILNDGLVLRAQRLLRWALNFTDKRKPWPENTPSPSTWINETEKQYVSKTNGAVVSGSVFILYHEFAHLYLDHMK